MVLWQELCAPALDPLRDCKQEWNTTEVGVKERLEYLFVALRRVLLSTANSAVPNQMLGNICFMHGNWIGHDSHYQPS